MAFQACRVIYKRKLMHLASSCCNGALFDAANPRASQELQYCPNAPAVDKGFRSSCCWALLSPGIPKPKPLLLFHGASSPVLLFVFLLPEMPPTSSPRAPTSFHMRHSLKRRPLVCLSLIQHQHVSESSHPHYSFRKVAAMAWPLSI